MTNINAIIEECRLMRADFEPHEWPAISMRDITSLCDEVERLQKQCEELTRVNLALMTFGNVQQVVSLLQALFDLQNGPPTERRTGDWVEVMGQAVTFLGEMERTGVSATEIKPIGGKS